jgi:DNA-binding LacI/PurR family transcriptional regulator
MTPKRPTQADVARFAGVSRATVSYVLNDQTNQRIPISADTRKRVLETIVELGYEPGARAQALRSGNTKTIGVTLPIYENPFFWQILSGISSEAQAAGYNLLLSQNPLTPEKERNNIKELAEQRVDGMILLLGYKTLPSPILKQLRKSNRPVVEITSSTSESDYVLQGYAEGTRALMAHLFELGHKRVGFVYGVHEETQAHDRLLTYHQIMEEVGLRANDDLVQECGPSLEDGYQAAHNLLSRSSRPTALLVSD